MTPRMMRFLLLCLLTAVTLNLDAQNCPRRIANCRGLCGWYVDQNGDGYCDLTINVQEIIYGNQRRQDSLARLAEEKEQRRRDSIENARIKPVDTVISGKSESKEVIKQELPTEEQPCPHQQGNSPCMKDSVPGNTFPQVTASPPPVASKAYDLLLVFGSCLGLYLLTFILSRRNVMKRSTHRKIWNVMLLLTFLATGLIGLFLVVQLNYNLLFDWFADLLYWHVEFGIAMAAISIFHLLWHMRYWLNLFTKAKQKDC